MAVNYTEESEYIKMLRRLGLGGVAEAHVNPTPGFSGPSAPPPQTIMGGGQPEWERAAASPEYRGLIAEEPMEPQQALPSAAMQQQQQQQQPAVQPRGGQTQAAFTPLAHTNLPSGGFPAPGAGTQLHAQSPLPGPAPSAGQMRMVEGPVGRAVPRAPAPSAADLTGLLPKTGSTATGQEWWERHREKAEAQARLKGEPYMPILPADKNAPVNTFDPSRWHSAGLPSEGFHAQSPLPGPAPSAGQMRMVEDPTLTVPWWKSKETWDAADWDRLFPRPEWYDATNPYFEGPLPQVYDEGDMPPVRPEEVEARRRFAGLTEAQKDELFKARRGDRISPLIPHNSDLVPFPGSAPLPPETAGAVLDLLQMGGGVPQPMPSAKMANEFPRERYGASPSIPPSGGSPAASNFAPGGSLADVDELRRQAAVRRRGSGEFPEERYGASPSGGGSSSPQDLYTPAMGDTLTGGYIWPGTTAQQIQASPGDPILPLPPPYKHDYRYRSGTLPGGEDLEGLSEEERRQREHRRPSGKWMPGSRLGNDMQVRVNQPIQAEGSPLNTLDALSLGPSSPAGGGTLQRMGDNQPFNPDFRPEGGTGEFGTRRSPETYIENVVQRHLQNMRAPADLDIMKVDTKQEQALRIQELLAKMDTYGGLTAYEKNELMALQAELFTAQKRQPATPAAEIDAGLGRYNREHGFHSR